MTNKYVPKVVFSVTNDLTYDRRMIRISNALHKAGIDVLLVGRKLDKSIELPPQPFAQHRIECLFESGKLFYLEYNIRLFFFLLKLKNIQIATAIDLDTIWPVTRASKIKKWKIVYDAHELFEEVPEVVNRPFVKSIWKWVGKRFIPLADLAYTVGDQLGVYFTKKYKKPFQVIRNVPPKIIERPPYKSNTNVILYQGMINQGRGVKEMIEALEFFPKFKFWVIGNGDDFEEIKAWTKSLSYSNQIKFFGFVAPQELPKYTSQATLGINLLNNTGLSYYYSLANKTFDYIQAGIPSIQMDFPEYANLQEKYDCFFLLKELKVAQIKDLLREINNDPSILIEKHQNALKAAEELHWESESKKLISLYKELLNRE